MGRRETSLASLSEKKNFRICLTFNGPAESLIRHGIAREVDAAEGLDLLDKAQDCNLVQFGENVQEEVGLSVIAAAVAAEALIVARKVWFLQPRSHDKFLFQK